MCYKDEDEELWQEDPYEYIRMKFGNGRGLGPLQSLHVANNVTCCVCVQQSVWWFRLQRSVLHGELWSLLCC